MESGRSFLRLVALVARRDYLRTIRRRGFLFGTLLLPLAVGGLLVISIVASTSLGGPGTSRPSVVLVNESDLPLAPVDTGELEVRLVGSDEARAGLASGRWQEFYVVPRGYPGNDEVERVFRPTRAVDLAALQRRASQQAGLVRYLRRGVAAAEGVPEATVERLVQPVAVREVDPSGQPASSGVGPVAILLPTLFTMLFVTSIFITSNYLLQSVTEEKENRVVEIVLSSVPALPLMAGKVIGLGACGLTQVAVWLATALVGLPALGALLAAGGAVPGAAGLPVSGSAGLGGPVVIGASGTPGGPAGAEPAIVVVAISYFVLGYLAYGALFAAVGAIAPGTREAQQYSGVFGFVAVIPFILSGLFLADPGSPVVTALVLFPMTSPAAALQLLLLAPEPPWALVGLSLVLLCGFVGLATIASARIFRATLLLYGVRPSVGRVVAAVVGRA
jgi:ABC-2 type transport system permease protein